MGRSLRAPPLGTSLNIDTSRPLTSALARRRFETRAAMRSDGPCWTDCPSQGPRSTHLRSSKRPVSSDPMRRAGPLSRRARRSARQPYLQPQERFDLGPDVGQDLRGYGALADGSPGAPVQALELVGENDAWRGLGDHDFEDVAFDPGRHRTADHHAANGVVPRRGENERRPMSGLFVPCLRVELKPDDIASLRNIVR